MTIAEAAEVLKAAGLEVSFGPDGIAAASDPQTPHDALAKQGVQAVFSFGFRMRKVGALWFLRHAETYGGPSEEYDRLEDAVARGLALFEAYQARKT